MGGSDHETLSSTSTNVSGDKYVCQNNCGSYFSTERSRKKHETYHCEKITDIVSNELNFSRRSKKITESNLPINMNADMYECKNSCGEYFSTDRSKKRHEI